MKKFLCILFILFAMNLSAQLQQTCIEPARVNPFYMCNDPYYNPVCGCDNKTYRNQCNAYYVNGVNTWRSGVCSGLDMDFFSNPVRWYEPLTVNLSYPELIMGNADIKIVDVYGKVWVQRIVNNFNRIMIQFDVSSLATGVYIIIVQSSLKTGVVKKFSKY